VIAEMNLSFNTAWERTKLHVYSEDIAELYCNTKKKPKTLYLYPKVTAMWATILSRNQSRIQLQYHSELRQSSTANVLLRTACEGLSSPNGIESWTRIIPEKQSSWAVHSDSQTCHITQTMTEYDGNLKTTIQNFGKWHSVYHSKCRNIG
jgi:hypothetical protein